MNYITKLQEQLLTAVQTSPYHEKTIVFGEGAEAPLLMMIGEAPVVTRKSRAVPLSARRGRTFPPFWRWSV